MIANKNTQAPRQHRAFWQEHTDQWKQSGLSKIAYSKKHNLKSVSFYNWSKKLENVDSSALSAVDHPTTFVPVKIDRSAASLRHCDQFVHVERAATDIALPVDLTGDQIQHWLQAIHALDV